MLPSDTKFGQTGAYAPGHGASRAVPPRRCGTPRRDTNRSQSRVRSEEPHLVVALTHERWCLAEALAEIQPPLAPSWLDRILQ